LETVRGGQLFEGGYAEGLLNLPGCEIAEPDVEDIPPAAYVFQRPEGFLQIASVVEFMQEEDINVIASQALQTVADGLEQMKAGGAPLILTVAHGEVCLGGDYHFVPHVLDQFTENSFGGALLVHICTIKCINSRFEAVLEHSLRFPEISIAAEAHGTETQ
jgi:hypothetical protein